MRPAKAGFDGSGLDRYRPVVYGGVMSNKEQQVIETVNLITKLEGELATARATLRGLLGTSPATVQASQAAKKRQTIKVVRNVSQEVLAYVTANPGQRANAIIKALNLGKREGTVRAALKKHQATGRLVNFAGDWHPPAKEKAPEVQPQGPVPNGVSDGGYMQSRMATD